MLIMWDNAILIPAIRLWPNRNNLVLKFFLSELMRIRNACINIWVCTMLQEQGRENRWGEHQEEDRRPAKSTQTISRLYFDFTLTYIVSVIDLQYKYITCLYEYRDTICLLFKKGKWTNKILTLPVSSSFLILLKCTWERKMHDLRQLQFNREKKC